MRRHRPRISIKPFAAALALFALSGLGTAAAAADACTGVNGVDYRFEEMQARRVVDDPPGSTIVLDSFIYRPLKHDRHQIVVFSHGSTGGLARDPKEPIAPDCAFRNFFLARGYTVVAPMRRGRGRSTGAYIEECALNVDPKCTPARLRELGGRALSEALKDSLAVLDQVVFAKLRPSGGKVILAGHSRGGFLSLAIAAARPMQVEAVVNFSGGWFGVVSNNEAENRARLEFMLKRLRAYGARFHGPTLWIYGARDQFYDQKAIDQFQTAFASGGGQAELAWVADHDLSNGHYVNTEAKLWSGRLDEFLTRAVR